MVQYADGIAHPLVTPAEAAAITSGAGAANQLGVRTVGKQIDLYVNGQFLATAATDTTGQGMFGVYAASAQTPGLAVAFSRLEAWEISP